MPYKTLDLSYIGDSAEFKYLDFAFILKGPPPKPIAFPAYE